MKRKFQVRFLEGSPPAMGAGYSAQGGSYFPEAHFGPVSVLPTVHQAKQDLFSECNGDITSVKAALLKCLCGVWRHGFG